MAGIYRVKLKNRRVMVKKYDNGDYLMIFKRLIEKDEEPKHEKIKHAAGDIILKGRVSIVRTRISEEAFKALCGIGYRHFRDEEEFVERSEKDSEEV